MEFKPSGGAPPTVQPAGAGVEAALSQLPAWWRPTGLPPSPPPGETMVVTQPGGRHSSPGGKRA